LLESFISLCITQHVHDDNLKQLYYDFERFLQLPRYKEDDLSTRGIVSILSVLAVLMPYDGEQQMLLRGLGSKYQRHWKYLVEMR
jgi:hypothetical protein